MARAFDSISTLWVLSLLFINGAVAKKMIINGEGLKTGEFLENDRYKFIMQSDCNLVLYEKIDNPIWSSATNGKGKSCRALLQNNGNLVIFSGMEVIWTSGPAPGPNYYRLIVQTDGNVVIYGGAIWATDTVRTKRRLF